MVSMFSEGSTLRFSSSATPVRVIRTLGGGGQGQVFEVDFAGEAMAMKWYFPSCLQRDPQLRDRLAACIRATAPNASFLWPILVLDPDDDSRRTLNIPAGSFGYVMKLRPPQFQPAVAHTAGRLEISLQQILRACFHLVEAFHALHSKGLCYKDISLGNLFLDPASGVILICDNDNIDVNGSELGGVRGTAGFMAPEVLLGLRCPDSNSDLFSLAVLLFRLLTRHDPFLGRLELQIRCFDEPARRRLYGEDPVFIFDPGDLRNRPDPELHSAALLTWPIYPAALQALFIQTFGPGLRDPARRVLTGQWQDELARTLDRRQICPACGQENFRSHQSPPPPCWSCGATLAPARRLQLPCADVVATPGTTLHRHHFDRLQPPQFDQPLAEIVAHPGDAGLLGLCNRGSSPWQVTLRQGQQLQVDPGRSCNLAATAAIVSDDGLIRIDP